MSDRTILFVDDEKNVLKSLKRLFANTDHEIILAISGKEGLKMFEENNINLVISDYRMPEMNGVQFLSKVKELYPDTIRIILSGYADVMAIVEAINDGEVYKFLSKPWNDHELLTTVKRAFEHYNLKIENKNLIDELQSANEELRQLTKNLEDEVKKRTKDLRIKNQALITSQKILNQLPMGVLGIDSLGMVVYMNQALRKYIDISNMELGISLTENSNDRIVNMVKESLKSNRVFQYK